MLVEHEFITTASKEAVFQRANEIFAALGFSPEVIERGAEEAVAFRRGVRNADYAKRVDRLPQFILLNFDRGRVTVAVSLQEARRHRQDKPIQQAMIMALANLTEECVGKGTQLHLVRQRWDEIHLRIASQDRRRRKRGLILLLCAAALLAGAIVAAVILN